MFTLPPTIMEVEVPGRWVLSSKGPFSTSRIVDKRVNQNHPFLTTKGPLKTTSYHSAIHVDNLSNLCRITRFQVNSLGCMQHISLRCTLMTTMSGESLLKCLVFGEVDGSLNMSTSQATFSWHSPFECPEWFAVGKRAHEQSGLC